MIAIVIDVLNSIPLLRICKVSSIFCVRVCRSVIIFSLITLNNLNPTYFANFREFTLFGRYAA